MQKLNEINFHIQQAQQQITKYQTLINNNETAMEELKKDILHLGEVKKLLIRLKNNKMIQDAFSINTKMISEFQSSKKLKNKTINIYEKINQGVNC